MTLSELQQKVYDARGLPNELADLHIQLACIFSKHSEEMMEIQLKKAEFWQIKDYQREVDREMNAVWEAKREKPLSDKQVEMMWLQTKEGKKEIKLKYTLKSLEKLMSSVKSALVNATIEARNI